MDHVESGGPPNFEQAFAPLAHHLFPDGCPLETEDLLSIWPSRTNRIAVSAKEARSSITELGRVASLKGLTESQLLAVILVACETLPKSEAVVVVVGAGSCSPLVDGSSKCFRDLIRCLLPSCSSSGSISSAVVTRLVAIRRCDGEGRTAVLRFLTLAVRSGVLVGHARQTLSDLYGVIVAWVADPDTCKDAVRLLHAVTRRKHVRLDRAQRLSDWYNSSGSLSSIWLLLQLFARYDPKGCGRFFPSTRGVLGSSAWSRCFQIPDAKWERDFSERASQLEQEEEEARPTKRARVAKNTTEQREHSLTSTLDWLNDAFDGVHSLSWGLVGNRERIRASDLLMDTSLQHLILLSSQNPNDSSIADTEVFRLRACLPYMLHEEWYEKNNTLDMGDDSDESSSASLILSDNGNESDSQEADDDKAEKEPEQTNEQMREGSRLHLLRVLASVASNSDALFPEAASFLLEEILPHWDGSDRMGQYICFDLLPMLSPCAFSELQSKVLRHLEPLFTYGSPRIQYAIVSGTLQTLLQRWGRLDWAEWTPIKNRRPDRDTDHITWKRRTLRELIQWTDNLLLKAFLVDDGHELLRLSSVEFFDKVAVLSTTGPFLASPSPALVYRLLLSQSALSVDLVCGLLAKYKKVFQKLKEEPALDPEENVRCSDRIAIFNCFIWDFCSFLWKGSPLPSLDPSTKDEARANSICFTDVSRETLVELHRDASRVKWALSITHGAVFAGYASEFMKKHKLQDDANILRGKIKVKYLEYLKERGLNGVYTFLTTFVGSLADREARKQK